MPNWCTTEIYINHNNKKKELNKLRDLIKRWTSHNAMKNDFGVSWLGNVVLNS